jgi:HEAT repeat protein
VITYKEVRLLLKRPDAQKVGAFCALHFLLGVSDIVGFFSSDALLIGRFGTASLFYVYFTECLLILGLSGLFYYLADRLPRRTLFYGWFVFLGLTVSIGWAILYGGSRGLWIHLGIRSFFNAVVVGSEIGYWLIAGDVFGHFESKRRFSSLVVAFIAGEIAGGWLLHELAPLVGSLHFLLASGVILILSPFLFVNRLTPSAKDRESPPMILGDEGAREADGDAGPAFSSRLAILLFVFWLAYTFFADGTDYVFSSKAVEWIRGEDDLAAYFGRIALWANLAILVYHLFLATPVLLRYGIDLTATVIPILIAVVWGIACLHPSLATLALAQGLIYIFIDHLAGARFFTILSVFPRAVRGRVKAFTEGFGRPLGTLLLFLMALTLAWPPIPDRLAWVLLVCALVFLSYPLFFRRAYFKHLIGCLDSRDSGLVTNAIQALGERNRHAAVAPLLSLLDRTREIHLQKTIVLSLGRIRDRTALHHIVQLFSVADERLQQSVIQAIDGYQDYGSILPLIRLLQHRRNVSFEVRMNALSLLTRLLGSKMIPFLLDGLGHKDLRVVANAVEALGLLKDRKTVPVLLPFLGHESHRIRANAAVALYPFWWMRREGVQKQALRTLDQLYCSEKGEARRAAIYAIGRLRLKRYEEELVAQLDATDKNLRREVGAALAQMKNPSFPESFVGLLLDPDEDLALSATKKMREFPRVSWLMILENVEKRPPEEQRLIAERLDKIGLSVFEDSPV